jgi:hypothetical protein
MRKREIRFFEKIGFLYPQENLIFQTENEKSDFFKGFLYPQENLIFQTEQKSSEK